MKEESAKFKMKNDSLFLFEQKIQEAKSLNEKRKQILNFSSNVNNLFIRPNGPTIEF